MKLLENLQYDPQTGMFTWSRAVAQKRAGSIAGGKTGLGYRLISVNGRQYYAHRLAWLAVHGVMPSAQIDHINGNRDDNRIDNLRLATNHQNAWNAKRRRNVLKGTTKYRGRWVAGITVCGKRYHLGVFDNEHEAHAAYCAAARKHFGEFFNPGAGE